MQMTMKMKVNPDYNSFFFYSQIVQLFYHYNVFIQLITIDGFVFIVSQCLNISLFPLRSEQYKHDVNFLSVQVRFSDYKKNFNNFYFKLAT